MKKIKMKTRKLILHEQWIEITRANGQTVTTYYPSNDEFEKLRQEMDPAPDLIYRRLFFPAGVPDDYAWTNCPIESRSLGGLFLMRLKVHDWLTVYRQESGLGNSKVLPSSNGTQPRPEQFGPCPCARCTKERNAQLAGLT